MSAQMRTEFAVSPRSSKREARGDCRPREVRATLQINKDEACLITGEGKHSHFEICKTYASPQEMLEHLREQLRSLIGCPLSADLGIRLRLVLPGGFYELGSRPEATWTSALSRAMGSGLEAQCPVALEELTTASLPLNPRNYWTVALRNETLEPWCRAADDLGIILEGIWTGPSTLVEHLLENSVNESTSWSDGRVFVTILSLSQTTSEANDLDVVRVARANIEPHCSLSLACQCQANGRPLPVCFYPAWWGHQLTLIDPSESFNLCRESFAAPHTVFRRTQVLSRAFRWAALGLLTFSIAALLMAQVQFKRATACAAEVQRLASVYQSAGSPTALPLESLNRQVEGWRNLRERGMLSSGRASQLELLARSISALPADVPVRIDRFRIDSNEVLIEGQARTAADARRVSDSLLAISGIAANSGHIAPPSQNETRFTVRFTRTSDQN